MTQNAPSVGIKVDKEDGFGVSGDIKTEAVSGLVYQPANHGFSG
ncbi:MAG TPA: hypothetical protein VJS43_08710 [Candidatus Acidoferrales bacterium]|nr:hypothetical protein [Candidatus Acidoferrales bacterium]